MTAGWGRPTTEDEPGASTLAHSLETGPPADLLASWSRRVVAVLLDHAVLATVVFLAFPVQPVVPPRYVPLPAVTGGDPAAPSWTSSGWVVATVLTLFLMQAYLGSTPGKLVVGIVVVRDGDGRPVGSLRTAGRLLAHVLDTILFIGYLRPLWNRQRRTFADSIAGTVVLVTRRPLPFRAGAREPVGGPWAAWELDEVPAWRVRTAAAAFTVCVAAVVFQSGSSGRGATLVEETCFFEPDAADDVAGLVGGSVAVQREPASQTRLGVERTVLGAEQGIRVTWDRSGRTSTEEEGVVVRVVFARADGTGARAVDHVLTSDGSVSGPGVPLTDGPTGVLLPLSTVDGLGDGWTWAMSTVVDGRESPRCVGRTV